MQLLLTLGGRVHRAPRLTWKPQPQGALGSQVPESLSEKRLAARHRLKGVKGPQAPDLTENMEPWGHRRMGTRSLFPFLPH